MRKPFTKRAEKKLGLTPGAVVYVGKDRTHPIQIEVIDYTQTEHEVRRVDSPEDCAPYRDSDTFTWINMNGIHDAGLVERLGKQFGLHPLILEDVVNTGHRPKLEESTDSIAVIVKMLYAYEDNSGVHSEQISIVFGRRWTLSFQETSQDVFEPFRQRLERTVPRVRSTIQGYLPYALVDAIVDHYFVLLEQIGERIEMLEDELSDRAQPESLAKIRALKRELIDLRKSVWPLREVIGGLERMESDLIDRSLAPYLRDLYEHTVQVIDTVETYREMVSSLLELYRTGISNRMNEIMKVLTIFATIFIPLGFLAGVFGMNFDPAASPYNMPELGLKYGYLMFWGLVVAVGGGLLIFFKRKGWL
jgi:magnesium transporter